MSNKTAHSRIVLLLASAFLWTVLVSNTRAELLGYWSGDSTGGMGETIPNDQGNADLDGELFGGASYSSDGAGHTGLPGDYAFSFPGEDEDYGELPPTEETFDEITITAWVNGFQNGVWAGIVLSRDGSQPIGLDYHAFDGLVNYIWNNDSSQTWNFISDLSIPDEEWTFVALTVTDEAATLYAGPKGDELESSANEIDHFPQDNFTAWRLAEDNCCGTQRNFAGLIDDVAIWNEALSDDDLARLHNLSATPLTLSGGGLTGDFNNDGVLDANDIDLLTTQVVNGNNPPTFDVNSDGQVDQEDRRIWIEQLKNTWYGDANLDGEFNSADFVAVFQVGEYEDGILLNSTWSEGDWNGDQNFSSGDFVIAFQSGGFEQGPRQQQATSAVPEPDGSIWAMFAIGVMARHRRSGGVVKISNQSCDGDDAG